MAKRKNDCTLDEMVGEYLKNGKCEKSLKLFAEKVERTKNDRMDILKKFVHYLKKKVSEKENMNDEDLGFEINFGAFQPEKRVSSI